MNLLSSQRESLEGILQKNNEIDHLRNQENFRTIMPQEHVELTIDNAQLRSNRDIGMIMRSTDHVKVLHTA